MAKGIKFRAKRVDNRQWSYGGLIQCDDYCIIDQGNEVYIEEEYNHRGDTHFFRLSGVMCDEKTIGQFIGRKDNTKKEIYEGDIITVNGHYPKIVQFIPEKAGFCIANISDFKNQDFWDIWQQPPTIWWDEMNIKVIGNIYDNKDLLED